MSRRYLMVSKTFTSSPPAPSPTLPPSTGTGWPTTKTFAPQFSPTREVLVSNLADAQTAVNNVQDGDDIIWTGGSYTGRLVISTSLVSRARIRAADGGTVTLTHPGSGLSYTLFCRGARNWIIGHSTGDMIFDGANTANNVIGVGLYSGTKESTGSGGAACRDMHFHNFTVRKSGQSLMRIAYDSYDIDVTNVTLHTSGRGGGKKDGYGEGFYLGSASGTADRTHDIRFKGVEAYDTTAEVFEYKGNTYNLSAESVYVHDVALSSSETFTKGAVAVRTSGANVSFSDFIIANITRDAGASATINNAVGIYSVNPDLQLTNGIIYGCDEEAIWQGGSGGKVRATHVTFWDNLATVKGSGVTLDACLYPSGSLGSATTTKSAVVASGDFVGPITGDAQVTYPGDGFTLSGTTHKVIVPSTALDIAGTTRVASRGAIE